MWVVTRYHYRISALISQTTFDMETGGSVAKCWLFSQASSVVRHDKYLGSLSKLTKKALPLFYKWLELCVAQMTT